MVDTGARIAILGYGMEGRAVARFLHLRGFTDVTVHDKHPVTVEVPYPSCTGDAAFVDLQDYDVLVRSPGIPLHHPMLQDAKSRGVVITSQTELFLEACPGITIGVTGTKGKTTTCSFLYRCLQEAGLPAVLVGNIGVEMLDALPRITEETYVVMELSSFQLQGLSKSPHIAAMLGITPEHLDYHVDMEEYQISKSHIFLHQKQDDLTFFAVDSPVVAQMVPMAQGQVVPVSLSGQGDLVVEDGKVFWKGVQLCRLDDIPVRSPALVINYVMAMVIASSLGVTPEAILEALRTFPGVPYRMELVHTYLGVNFWNDSAGTTPEAAIAAIHAFDEPMLLILGGGEKNVAFDGLIDALLTATHVRTVVTVGPMAGRRIFLELQKALEHVSCTHLVVDHVDDYAGVQELIKRDLPFVRHVVLSPACSSFDLFADYKARGDAFTAMVKKL